MRSSARASSPSRQQRVDERESRRDDDEQREHRAETVDGEGRTVGGEGRGCGPGAAVPGAAAVPARGLAQAQAHRQEAQGAERAEKKAHEHPALRVARRERAAARRADEKRRQGHRRERGEHAEADAVAAEPGALVVVGREFGGERHVGHLDHGVAERKQQERQQRAQEGRGGVCGGRQPQQREARAERQRAPADEGQAPRSPLEAVGQEAHRRVEQGVEQPPGDEHGPRPERLEPADVDQKVQQPGVERDEGEGAADVGDAVSEAVSARKPRLHVPAA